MLNERLSGYLNYFEELAEQPPNHWDGFYLTQHEHRNFALRFQIAFACYALGALCLHADAERVDQERALRAMVALIERMQQRRIWAYWSIDAERRGINPDPVYRANAQYAGHLAMMLGIFEAAGGDERYDETFTLLWTSSEQFSYSHHTLIYALWQQMLDNHHHGIDGDAGRTYLIHMNPVMWAHVLHDAMHGSTYQAINDEWIEFVRRRMILHGPRMQGRGVFSFLYMSNVHMPVTTGINFVDAYTLSFMALLYPELVQSLYPRFCRGIQRTTGRGGVRQSYVPSASAWDTMELSDISLTTGFGYLLAVHMRDTALASELLAYADEHLQPVERDTKRYYNGGLATPLTTAIFALAEAGGLHAFSDIAQGTRPHKKIPFTASTATSTSPDNQDNSNTAQPQKDPDYDAPIVVKKRSNNEPQQGDPEEY